MIHDGAEVVPRALQTARARQLQEILEETLQPLGLTTNGLHLEQSATAVAKILRQEFEVDHHGGEGIAQLMGKPAGQLGNLGDGAPFPRADGLRVWLAWGFVQRN